MNDFIEREEYCQVFCDYHRECPGAVQCALWRVPAADVAPVRIGRWIPFNSEAAGDIQYCSNCKIGSAAKSDFCPHCGAKMDERCR